MLCYNKIDLSEGIDIAKSKDSKEYIWYSNHGFKLKNLVFNGCDDLTMLGLSFSNFSICLLGLTILLLSLLTHSSQRSPPYRNQS